MSTLKAIIDSGFILGVPCLIGYVIGKSNKKQEQEQHKLPILSYKEYNKLPILSYKEYNKMQTGSFDMRVDHILKPNFQYALPEDMRKYNQDGYKSLNIKKLRTYACVMTMEDRLKIRTDEDKYMKENEIKYIDSYNYQKYNYHLINLNSKILTRLLLKKYNKELTHPYYKNLINQEYYNTPENIKLIENYENALKDLIENDLIKSPNYQISNE